MILPNKICIGHFFLVILQRKINAFFNDKQNNGTHEGAANLVRLL